jgi:hypothetical protein
VHQPGVILSIWLTQRPESIWMSLISSQFFQMNVWYLKINLEHTLFHYSHSSCRYIHCYN